MNPTISIFTLLISLLISQAVSAKGKSQAEIIEQLHQIEINSGLFRRTIGRSSTFSSTLANDRSTSIEDYKEMGFKEIFLETQENDTAHTLAYLPSSPRPFIVFVGGLSSSVNMNSFTEIVIPFVQKYDYGIILFESSSSGSWTKRNQRLILSGYEAGWDLYLRLKALKEDVEIGPLMQETSVVGLSAGGSDAANASYFDSILKTNLISGAVLAISSPADREKALISIRKKTGGPGFIVSRMFKGIYTGSMELIKKIADVTFDWVYLDAPLDNVFETVYIKSSIEYFQTHDHHFSDTNSVRKIPFDVENEPNFTLAEYKNLFSLKRSARSINKPLLYLHAEDDPIVDYSISTSTIKNVAHNSNIGLMSMPHGGHVGFTYTYSNDWLNTLIVNYIHYWGKHPKEYYNKKQPSKIVLPADYENRCADNSYASMTDPICN